MFCTVYQLRENGEKLPTETVRAHAVQGFLVVGRRGGWPVRDARLLEKQRSSVEVLPRLEHVKDCAIEGGVLLRGLVCVSYQQYKRQTWWCVPLTKVQLSTPTGGPAVPGAHLDHRSRWQLDFVAEVQRLTSGEADVHQAADAASEAYPQHRNGDPAAAARELWE